MFRITVDKYTIVVTESKFPDLYEHDYRQALFAEEIDLNVPSQTPQSQSPCVVAVSSQGENGGLPFLMVTQNYDPDDSAGFYPGIIVVPETSLMMIGAGQRLLAYTLTLPPTRLWEDSASFGFLGWGRHDDTIIMAATLEMAAWDITGRKLWSRYVEPPWTYSVTDGIVILDVMGDETRFPLVAGPDA